MRNILSRFICHCPFTPRRVGNKFPVISTSRYRYSFNFWSLISDRILCTTVGTSVFMCNRKTIFHQLCVFLLAGK